MRDPDDDATSTLSPGRLFSSQKQLALYDYMAEVVIRDVGHAVEDDSLASAEGAAA